MVFANRIIIKDKHKSKPINIPNRPSTFYDKALCEEFSKHFDFNFSKEKSKKLVKK